ncbi:MAG TPA: serine hydrolase domain-containing protein, partial [Micromonosporaceae bacterium]
MKSLPAKVLAIATAHPLLRARHPAAPKGEGLSMRRLLALLSAGAMVAVLAIAAPVSGHPGQPSAKFDPNEVDWYSAYERSGPDFDTILANWRRYGFMPVDFEADGFDGEPEFGGAAQRNLDNRDWMLDPMMTSAEYLETSALAQQRGMRMVDREIFRHKGTWYFGALWIKNVEGLASAYQWGMTIDTLLPFLQRERDLGRLPIDFDMWYESTGMKYAVITLANGEGLDWRLEPDLSYAQFLAKDDQYGIEGFRTVSIDSSLGTTQRFGAIWWENVNGRSWASRLANTDTNHENQWHELVDAGFRQIFTGRFETADGESHHLSAWRQNSPRYNWDLRVPVDNAVNTVLDDRDLPGVQVAVMQAGQLMYSRGFGYADLDAGIKMDSTHVLRTASVSKAVAGALTLRLTERSSTDALSKFDAVSEWIPNAAGMHPITTLEQMMSMRGCVRHYAAREDYSDPEVESAQLAADATMATTKYASATEALSEYLNDPVVCTVGTYHYSSFSHGIGAAVLEVATGKTSTQLIQEEISTPLGLTTLRVEDLDDDAVNRPVMYQGAGNDVVDPFNAQKCSHHSAVGSSPTPQ